MDDADWEEYFRNPEDEEDPEYYEQDTEDPEAGAGAEDPRVPISDTKVRDPPIGAGFLRFRRTRRTTRTLVDRPVILNGYATSEPKKMSYSTQSRSSKYLTCEEVQSILLVEKVSDKGTLNGSYECENNLVSVLNEDLDNGEFENQEYSMTESSSTTLGQHCLHQSHNKILAS